jgi:hypothetical protein
LTPGGDVQSAHSSVLYVPQPATESARAGAGPP